MANRFNESDLQRLLQLYQPAVTRIIGREVQDGDKVEDLAHEILVALVAVLGKFNDPAALQSPSTP